jgi:hypothetical protein
MKKYVCTMRPLQWHPAQIISLVLLTLALASCKHEIPQPLPPGGGNGGGPPVDPTPCDPNTVYFVNDVLPFLVSTCAQPDCHDAVSHQDGVRLYDYAALMGSDVVTPGDPGDSDLYEALTEDDPDKIMPPPSTGITLTSSQIQMIATWIQQGAQNNSCTAECDPQNFTFAATVQPIIQQKCQGCHSGSQPDGGLSLTSYSQISSAALSGALMAGLTGTQGVPVMPYGTSGLPQCQIEQIQNWINAGAPNN